MIGKKINQLATELAPASTDLTIIGNPTTGVSKKITLAQLGAIFSGAVSFYTNYAAFPATGTLDVIFCAKDTQKLYLWSGSAYVEVFPSQALLDTYQLRSEKGNANGYASLDSTGKVPVSQLPSSIMEYKGTWSAATNTPTLANGTGDTGDVYICNAAGSVNFGAGAITFAVGDYVIYSGSIWQRSSGAVGTVTSVAASITGNAIGITGSPVTTSGTLALAFAGTSAQYVNGAGNLVTFPSIISQAQNIVSEVYNNTGATLTKGTIVYINGGQGNLPTVTKALATGDSTSAQTYGIVQADITNMNNGYVVVAGRLIDLDTQAYSNGTQLYLSGTTAGTWTSTKPYAPIHLVYVGIVVRSHPTQGVVEVKIQNGYEMDELHNVSAQTPTNNDGLFWEASTSLWKNKSISTILGGTPITGSGNVNAIPKFTANSVLGNSVMEDDGNFVSMRGLKLNVVAGSGSSINFGQASSISAAGLGYSSIGASGTAGFIFYIDQNTTQRSFIIDVNNINSATTRNYSMPNASGTFALTSDIPSLTGYVPYTGATNNVNLGIYDLYARSLYVEGTASYQSGLVIKQISGFNFVTGAYTQLAPSGIYDLNVVHNQTNGTRRIYQLSVAGLQDGDNFQYLVPRKNGTFAMTSDIPSLTGYVQGSGTTNYLPKFTGTSTIGNSQIFDNGTNVGIGTASPNGKLTLSYSSSLVDGLIFINTASGGRQWRIGDGSGVSAGSFGFYDATAAATRMILDASGNLGLGVTPSAWVSGRTAIQMGGTVSYIVGNSTFAANANNYFDASVGNVYINNGFATQYAQFSGQHVFYTAPSGTAGNAISFTQAMTLNASGNLSIGNTNDTYKLDVSGTGRFTGNVIGSSAIFNSSITANNSVSGGAITLTGTTNYGFVEDANSVRRIWFENTGSYRTLFDLPSAGTNFSFRNNAGTILASISSTGAATFSSSVTATGGAYIPNGTYYYAQRSTGGANIGVLGFASGSDTLTIKGGTSGASNSINFEDTGGIIASFYAGRLGIGTTSPSYKLVVDHGTTSQYVASFRNTGDNLQIKIGSTTGGLLNIQGSTILTDAAYNIALQAQGGNVGIGTTSPSYKLHVAGTSVGFINPNSPSDLSATQTLVMGGVNGNNAYLQAVPMDWYAQNYSLEIGTVASSSAQKTHMRFVTEGSERMRITSGGNVGIGTTSPAWNLHVSGNDIAVKGTSVGNTSVRIASSGQTLGTDSFDLISDGSAAYAWNRANLPLVFGTNATERMRIKSNGIINLSNVPSSSAGLSSGDIYKTVAGVLMIV